MTHYWFTTHPNEKLSKLALWTFLLAFVVILLGAYTRLTDAGLSCPDWPHCYGYLTAPHTEQQLLTAQQNYPATPVNTKKAWTEMTHRYVAGFEGLLILLVGIKLLRTQGGVRLSNVVVALTLFALLLTQVTLGMLTVTEKLKPSIVLGHLLIGISILSLLWWTYLNQAGLSNSFIVRSPARFKFFLWLGLLILFCQISLGGWVSTHNAALACLDFPYCNGNFMPAFSWHNLHADPASIHMLHRLGALVTAVYLFFICLALLFHNYFRTLAWFMLALLALQLTLGVLNIIWLRPVWVALMHQTVAILLLLSFLTALVKTYRFLDNRHAYLG